MATNKDTALIVGGLATVLGLGFVLLRPKKAAAATKPKLAAVGAPTIS